jgi:hypothetical protein
METDNLRADLQWFANNSLAEQAVRLGGVTLSGAAVWGYLAEGQAQLRKVLALLGAAGHPESWVQLLGSASTLGYFRGD